MGTVYAELSMSIDGYIAGPNISDELPLGERGESLHDWMWQDRTAAESTAFEEDAFRDVGALVLGSGTPLFGETLAGTTLTPAGASAEGQVIHLSLAATR